MTLKELNPQVGDFIYKKSWADGVGFLILKLDIEQDHEKGVGGYKTKNMVMTVYYNTDSFIPYDLAGDWVKVGNMATDPSLKFKVKRRTI